MISGLTVTSFNFGCKVNIYETEAIVRLFTDEGCIPVDDKQADICIVNTCNVTATGAGKCRQAIRKLANEKKEGSVLIVMGCYSQNSPEEVAGIKGVDIIAGTTDRCSLVGETLKYLASPDKSKPLILVQKDIYKVRDLDYEEMNITGMEGHTRAFVKIQDGCNQFCTYCNIPYVRGNIRSRKIESILPEVRTLAQKGYKEIVLSGIHLASYGKDHCAEGTLAHVVESLSDINGLERIRLGSIEPMYFDSDIIKRLAQNPKFCHHFHLSLQSGSDTVLKRMNRKYTCSEYENIVETIREYMPDAGITTDIMVGFPGETEEEFADTCRFAEKIGFSRTHIFPFSSRKGTRAALMEGQISKEIKKHRASELQKIALATERNFIESYKGKILDVLTETVSKGMTEGYGGNYIKVKIPGEHPNNEIIRVRVTDCFDDYCIAKK